MSYSHFKIFQKYCMPLRKCKEETGRLPILSPWPWGSDCQKSMSSPWEFHIHMQPRKVTFHQTPQEENDPKGCETRPSIYYKPNSSIKWRPSYGRVIILIYHTIIFVFLCGSQQETSTENLPGEIWKLKLRMLTPVFHSRCLMKRKVGPQRVANHFCPDFGISQTRKYF